MRPHKQKGCVCGSQQNVPAWFPNTYLDTILNYILWGYENPNGENMFFLNLSKIHCIVLRINMSMLYLNKGGLTSDGIFNFVTSLKSDLKSLYKFYKNKQLGSNISIKKRNVFKVNSVQEACSKRFGVHISKFEILQTTWKNKKQ